MARKKKRVVRRPAKPARRKKHVTPKKRSRKVPHKKPARRVRKHPARAARKRTPTRPAKRTRKAAPRKPAPRKQGRKSRPRLDPQRAEILLTQLTNKLAKAKRPADIKRISREIGDVMNERRALGFRTALVDDLPPGPERPVRVIERDEDDEEEEEFIGPPGDSYDVDFELIDWEAFDWGDVIDDIGDEEEDGYGDEQAK